MIILKKLIYIIFVPIFLLFTTSATIRNTKSSYIVLEKTSKRILEGDNENEQMLVASTVKILTAITVIENYNLEEEISITASDVNEVGSKVYLQENERVKRIDLLYALILRSANDAASALSNRNNGEFIYLMNETAKKIGMKNSVFENASGLDEREYNLSTAYDMALLTAYAVNNEIFKSIASSHTYSCRSNLRGYTWINKHKLVKNDDSFVLGKTGFTTKSGRILVSNYYEDNKDIIIVTINYSDDWSFHKKCSQSINEYEFKQIFKSGIYEIELEKTYYLACYNDIVIPIREDEYENINISFIIYNDYAMMRIYLYNDIICEYKLEIYDEAKLDLNMIIEALN